MRCPNRGMWSWIRSRLLSHALSAYYRHLSLRRNHEAMQRLRALGRFTRGGGTRFRRALGVRLTHNSREKVLAKTFCAPYVHAR